MKALYRTRKPLQTYRKDLTFDFAFAFNRKLYFYPPTRRKSLQVGISSTRYNTSEFGGGTFKGVSQPHITNHTNKNHIIQIQKKLGNVKYLIRSLWN